MERGPMAPLSDDDRLDLSILDPMEEPGRWAVMMERTAARVDQVLGRRAIDPLTLIASWMRTVTTVGAVMIAVLIPIELVLERREAGQDQVERLAQLSAESLRGGDPMTADALVRALEGNA